MADFPNDVMVIDAPFSGFPLHLFLIKGEGWTLIDTGIIETPKKYIFPFLEEHGISPDEVRHVVITHGHHDHFGGNIQVYEACKNAVFYAHEKDAGWIEEPLKYYNEMYLSFGEQWKPDDDYFNGVMAFMDRDCPVDKRLNQESGLINLGGGTIMQYKWIGSHSPGEMILAVYPQKCLFVGDAIQGYGTLNDNGLITFPLYSDVKHYLKGLSTIENTDCDWICTSHQGNFLTKDISPQIELSRNFALEHGKNILKVLGEANHPLGLHDLAVALHEKCYPQHELAYQIHATSYAQVKYLVQEDLIRAVPYEGHIAWVLK